MAAPRRLALPLALVVALLAACASSGSSAVRAPSSSTLPPGSATTSAPAAAGAATPAFVPAPLAWHGCGDDQCAVLRVPRDHTLPGGPQIQLALRKVAARDGSARLGTLLVNPGGPGAPGAAFAPTVAQRLPSAVRDRFDVVGWDPRGTGDSTRVECGDRLDYVFAPDSAARAGPGRAALESAARRFAAACGQGSPDLLAHLRTTDSVQDMDVIRQALGEPKLTYAGFSYGTLLGALYAQTFPTHVRALILDGALDPSLTLEQTNVQQAQGFGQSLDAFFRWCAASSSCAFRHGGNPRAAYEALRARVEASPMTAHGRTLGPTQLDLAVSSPLYLGRSAYAQLADELAAAAGGDPSGLIEEFDSYVGRRDDGTYDGVWAAFIATSCADGPDLPLPEYEALQARAAIAAPDFGASNVGLGYACSFWPVAGANGGPTPVAAPAAPPIVVIGTTGDPATPVAWAGGLARQLGSGRLVTVDGTSHTSLLGDNQCVRSVATAYLVDLTPPADGTRCAA